MNDIVVSPEYELPATMADLSRFVLVGREKLVAVRAEIRAIEKVGLAKEVREQKLKEAQAISEAVLDAEVRIGELMRNVSKVKNNNPNGNNQHRGQRPSGGSSSSNNSKTKKKAIEDAGFTKTQAQRFEVLAANPEIVEQAKAEACENNDIVLREGEALKRPIRISLYV